MIVENGSEDLRTFRLWLTWVGLGPVSMYNGIVEIFLKKKTAVKPERMTSVHSRILQSGVIEVSHGNTGQTS